MAARRIVSLDQVSDYPLTWPPDKPRAAKRIAGTFQANLPQTEREIDAELRTWRVSRWVLSMAPRHRHRTDDPGVALWFYRPLREGDASQRINKPEDLRVLACDRYVSLAHNARAILLTLNALRSIERWGAYTLEMATEGLRAIPDLRGKPPPEPSGPPWWETLGVGEAAQTWPIEAIEAVYKQKAARFAGHDETLASLNVAIEAARREKGKI